mmetsp:Transcript_28304/g.45649  ORF Transcript_28304/g.45649 Transcript_28304/m.45649 type:complete len:92 (+) Transcript_28304:227-502(+)
MGGLDENAWWASFWWFGCIAMCFIVMADKKVNRKLTAAGHRIVCTYLIEFTLLHLFMLHFFFCKGCPGSPWIAVGLSKFPVQPKIVSLCTP